MSKMREYFSTHLAGHGLDLGALHRPMVKHDGMRVKYVDRFPVAKLREHYPELASQPLQEADIIDDAETLETILSETQDFVISAHVIEHMRNPLGALESWIRVLKPGGILYLVVPDYRKIFDRDRDPTSLSHVITDYELRSTNRDWQHYLEYARFVDKAPDVKAHALDLLTRDYSIHFHCWVPDSMEELLRYFALRIAPVSIWGPSVDAADDHEFHFLIKKQTAGTALERWREKMKQRMKG